MDEEEVRVKVGTWFETHAKEVDDEDVVDYVSGVVSTDEDLCESIRRGSLTELIETLGPILEDALGLEDDINAETKIDALCSSFAKQVLAGPEVNHGRPVAKVESARGAAAARGEPT